MRLIDADALLINAEQYRCGRGEYSRMVDVWHIEHAPTIEAEPVRHGRWVNERMLVGGFAEKWGCDCSECGETIEEPLWKPNYCPNCGAKMDKENDDEILQ